MARAWALPETVIVALGKHHTSCPEQESTPVRIVSLADRFAHLTERGAVLTSDAVLGHPALAALEIYPDVLEKIVKRAGVVKETIGVMS